MGEFCCKSGQDEKFCESVAAPIEFEIDTYENKDETNPIKRATEMFLA